MAAVDDLADRFVGEFAGADPCAAAVLGIAGHDGELTDHSPDGVAARADLTRRTLDALDRLPPPGDERERVAAAVLRERLEVERTLEEIGAREGYLDSTDGPVHLLLMSFEVLRRGADTPWDAVRSRLVALPGAVQGMRAGLESARAAGRVVPRRQVLRSARAAREGRGQLEGLCAGRPELEAPLRAALDALEGFARYLTEDLAPHAPERDAVGRDRYALAVAEFLGTGLDLEETYAWGWEELARIEADMAAAAARIAPGLPVAEVAARLDADPAHRVPDAAAFLDHIQGLADRAVEDLAGTHFDIEGPLRRVECRPSPTDSGIYYLPPSEDGRRPGTVWWTVHEGQDEFVTWNVPSIMYHEGVPGHHLQLGTAATHEGLNRFQRVFTEVYPGWGEGWALYAERLMGELGYYRDPAHELGMLVAGQQIRAVRVIVDIGLHLELPIPHGQGFHPGETWTPQLAWEFLRARSGPVPDATVDFEIDRYLGRPGQAISYKVGERVWLEAREGARRAAERAGDRFDLKAFHRRALALGPMGLDLLTEQLTT